MPKIPEAKKKKMFVQIRVHENQRDKIREKARAMDMTVTDMILESLNRITPWKPQAQPAPEVMALEQAKVREIAKIGNNLNQIAHFCNTYKSDTDCVEILKHLVEIEHKIKKVLK